MNVVRDGISYNGINDYIPTDISSFTQRSIDEIIILDTIMPDLDDILKVSVSIVLDDGKIVKTAQGTSLEGQLLTGYKLLSEGMFIVRIDYCSESNNGCIYTFRKSIYFNNATTISKNKGESGKIIENVYVEDIYAEKLNERELIVNISFIFTSEDY